MSAEQVKTALKQLHEDLRVTSSLDPELRSLLLEIDRDIQELLRTETATSPVSPSTAGLVTRIEDVASDFALKHPNVEGVLRRLADGLGQMGV